MPRAAEEYQLKQRQFQSQRVGREPALDTADMEQRRESFGDNERESLDN